MSEATLPHPDDEVDPATLDEIEEELAEDEGDGNAFTVAPTDVPTPPKPEPEPEPEKP